MLFPTRVLDTESQRSNTDRGKFETLTGVTHEGLLERWFGPKDKATGLRPRKDEKKGTDPTFTTCSSFLSRFATRIRQAGALATSFTNLYTGKTQDVITRGFELNVEIGWEWAGGGTSPHPGDFFMLGKKYENGQFTEHAGVILAIEGNMWDKVAGGAGGRGEDESKSHDGVKRTGLETKPTNVLGWLNVDRHFRGWAGPGAEDAIYDENEEDIYEDL